MDTFENGTLAEEQPDMVMAVCWECGQTKHCHEHLVLHGNPVPHLP